MSQLLIFDAYELVPGAGKSIGIYNYSKNLWRALQQLRVDGASELTWCVICNVANVGDFPVTGPAERFRAHVVDSEPPGRFARQHWLRWRAAWISRSLGAAGYFSPKGFLPAGMKLGLRGGRSIVVVHDLIPLWYRDRLPGYFGAVEEWLVNGGLLKATRNADAVVAISQATAADIRARTGREAGVHVVYNGVPFTPAGERPRPGPYLFAVSSALPHKNMDGLIGAYQSYRASTSDPLPLVVCGGSPPAVAGVEAVRNLSDAALHGYYAHARAVLFMSHIEGFGFPPVEAMLHGTPVLCSDIPSLREVTLGQAVYASPTDGHAAGNALARMLQDTQVTKPEAADARRRAAQSFTWSACAAGVSRVVGESLQ
ncbi:MAG: glycosyltransferase family 4 protein [Burkholderiales bacterium]|nr:glycosyltransferase family 4 protein [Burkholderiales bacterium]